MSGTIRGFALALALTALLASLVFARSDGGLQPQISKHARLVAQMEERHRKSLAAAERAHIARLDHLLWSAMESYDLQSANEIDAARSEAREVLSDLEAGPANSASATARLVGTWSVRHRDWHGDLELYEDGRFGRPSWGEKHRYEGTWSMENGRLRLRWHGYGPEVITPALAFRSATATMVRRR